MKYSEAFVEGAQQFNATTGLWDGVLTSTKHFLGDGATFDGIDEGNATVYNMKEFLNVNFAGYEGSINSCGGNVMCSYSAINRLPMAMDSELLDGVLKNGIVSDKPFDGFIISDYDEIGKLAGQEWPTSNIHMTNEESIITIINSSVDMLMLASTHWDISIEYTTNVILDAI